MKIVESSCSRALVNDVISKQGKKETTFMDLCHVTGFLSKMNFMYNLYNNLPCVPSEMCHMHQVYAPVPLREDFWGVVFVLQSPRLLIP